MKVPVTQDRSQYQIRQNSVPVNPSMSDPEPESSPSENQYMVSPGIPSIVEEENTGKSRLESELENQIK